MAIIMLLALIIIGPKDLPRVARSIGQWVRKGRMLAREFQTSLEDMAKEAELDDVKKEIEKVGKTDLKKAVENTIDPKGELTKAFDPSSPNTASTAKADSKQDNATSASSSPAKALNGSVETKAADGAMKPAKSSPSSSTPKAPRSKPAGSTKTSAAKKPVSKAPVSKVKEPAGTKAAKKPAAPRKRTAKAATSAKTAKSSSAADKGGPAMTAKSS